MNFIIIIEKRISLIATLFLKNFYHIWAKKKKKYLHELILMTHNITLKFLYISPHRLPFVLSVNFDFFSCSTFECYQKCNSRQKYHSSTMNVARYENDINKRLRLCYNLCYNCQQVNFSWNAISFFRLNEGNCKKNFFLGNAVAIRLEIVD